MSEWFRTRCVIGFILAASALVAGPVAGEPTPVELSKLWEHHMFGGESQRSTCHGYRFYDFNFGDLSEETAK